MSKFVCGFPGLENVGKKSNLGQFNTTKSDYILSGFETFASGKTWIDPFAGNGDLLYWINKFNPIETKGYDIDPDKNYETQDTLKNPLNYENKYIIANPPYLARNKNKDKTLYDQYQLDDLYKIAIKTIIGCEGGILIVPLNFLSSENSTIRNQFFQEYKILSCKVFEETVFEDTDYTVCSFYFEKDKSNEQILPLTFLPSQKTLNLPIKSPNWTLCQEFEYYLAEDFKGITRYTEKNSKGEVPYIISINDLKTKKEQLCDENVKNNIILLRAIDTGTPEGRIKLEDIRTYGIDCLIGLNTSRNFAHIRFENPPSIEIQLKIIENFNKTLENFREKYNSMFLTAFRNSTAHYSRKRISFEVAYRLIKKVYLHLSDEIPSLFP